MSRGLDEIARDAVELLPSERLTLAQILLEVSEIPGEPVEEIEAAWEDEIVRRIQRIDAGTAKGKAWEDVLADVNKRLGE